MSDEKQPQPARIVIEFSQLDNGVISANIDYSSNDEQNELLKQASHALTLVLGKKVLPYIMSEIVNEIKNPSHKEDSNEHTCH